MDQTLFCLADIMFNIINQGLQLRELHFRCTLYVDVRETCS